MTTTRTGSIPIGFRKLGSDWQKDPITAARWAKDNGFAGLDLPAVEPAQIKQITQMGLRVGTVDMKQWNALLSPDAGKRKAAAQENIDYIKSAVAAGAKVFFTVLLPEDNNRPRVENLQFAVESYGLIAQGVAGRGAQIAIEGWPGPGPVLPALACNPETYRIMIKETPGPVVGVNFDPSHLLRMFIDPVRFVGEFAPRVYHMHGKDTEIFPDALYEIGASQSGARAKNYPWGGTYWRYTIPGHGGTNWLSLLATLQQAKYSGMVAIELEDMNFNGSEAGEQRGFTIARDFLAGV